MSGASTSVLAGTGQGLGNLTVNRPQSDRPSFEPTNLGNELGTRESSADNVVISAPKTPRSPVNRVPNRRSLVPVRAPIYEKAFESPRFVGRNNRGNCPTIIDRYAKRPEASPPRGGPVVHNTSRWFDILDYDGSGEISLEELEDPLISTGIVNSREECQSFIRTVDQDGSGEIGFKEFLKLLNPKLDSSATSSRKKGHVSKDSAAGDHKKMPHIYKAVNSKAVRKLQGIVSKTDRDMSSIVHQQRRKLILDAITSLYTYPTKGEKKDSQESIVNGSLISSAPTTSREKMESNIMKRQQLEVMARVVARLKSLPTT
ncbi:hypothetical protein CYMTET_32287 [Cymbomonas tetramitiformis]|uniref:EF-hand domain-containing protein n=1 Tax=Cymbomonas tetramitiformis TaxID=36881 RepID=A0AAE0FFL2_9CHLO|nr:hypothetical protein CYMTET_32287 [Cymbomonas tetramitiformis]